MNTIDLRGCVVAVIGAGTMGAGIAQIAAQAGHPVWLHDAREGAAAAACEQLATTLRGLAAKGKLTQEAADAAIERIRPAAQLADLADAGLVIEAIVENLAIKQGLLRDLEALLAPTAVLASNTSSLSITALAKGLTSPGRVVGMHFFNPVPLMKLVEVVSGLRTDPLVAEAVHALSGHWGKTAVHARSTPGFIVNRIARPYYAEALALLQERAATPAQIDAVLRGAGFRMGPCELMDLIGHDVNYAVTESVYAANYGDKRFVPSLVQKELVDAGLLGRKSGAGFYRYPHEAVPPALAGEAVSLVGRPLTVHGAGRLADRLAQALLAQGLSVTRDTGSSWTGVAIGAGQLRQTDGRCAQQLAAELGCADVAVFDWALTDTPRAALAHAVAFSASAIFASECAALLQMAGFVPIAVEDAAGLVVARTIAMLINEAADAVQQGVCDAVGADIAMKLGTGYPAGPFEWLLQLGGGEVIRLLDALQQATRSERYRVSHWLRQQGWRKLIAAVPAP
jgi:3-hydroxybutyryl-CoA dehydrogenase